MDGDGSSKRPNQIVLSEQLNGKRVSSPEEGRRALLRWPLHGGLGLPNLQSLDDGVGALELQPSDATPVALDKLVVRPATPPRRGDSRGGKAGG